MYFYNQVHITYLSGERNVEVTSPWDKDNIRRIVCHSYGSLSSLVAISPRTSDKVIAAVSQSIQKEMQSICSVQHDSVLLDGSEGLKYFSWEAWAIKSSTYISQIISNPFTSSRKLKHNLCHHLHSPEEEIWKNVSCAKSNLYSSVFKRLQ